MHSTGYDSGKVVSYSKFPSDKTSSLFSGVGFWTRSSNLFINNLQVLDVLLPIAKAVKKKDFLFIAVKPQKSPAVSSSSLKGLIFFCFFLQMSKTHLIHVLITRHLL